MAKQFNALSAHLTIPSEVKQPLEKEERCLRFGTCQGFLPKLTTGPFLLRMNDAEHTTIYTKPFPNYTGERTNAENRQLAGFHVESYPKEYVI